MTESFKTLAQLYNAQPPVWPDDLFGKIQQAVTTSPGKLVILDDDPTGT